MNTAIPASRPSHDEALPFSGVLTKLEHGDANWRDFQRKFVDHVVVKRATIQTCGGMRQRINGKIDLNEASHRQVFADYADTPESVRWCGSA